MSKPIARSKKSKAAAATGGGNDLAFTAAELTYWDTPEGKRAKKLLETSGKIPADDLIDSLSAELAIRRTTGPLDSPDVHELLARRDHARNIHLARVKRNWSFSWLYDLCDAYLEKLVTREYLLSQTAVGRSVIEGLGVGMNCSDDLRAFWAIASKVAEHRPLPDRPRTLTGLSVVELEGEVYRLKFWCATAPEFV